MHSDQSAAGSSAQARTSSRSATAVRFDLSWQSDSVQHCDSLYLPAVRLWRDSLPRPLKDALMNRPVGHRETLQFSPGQLVVNRQEKQVLRLNANAFNRRFMGRGELRPRRGRFYPRAILRGLWDMHATDRTPCRVAEVSADTLVVDLNHPLAGKDLTLTATVAAGLPATVAHGPAAADLRARLADDGPGMQARWQGRPTDFFADQPFDRADDDDPAFYARARLVDHLDSTAIAEISALYGRLIPRRSRILDLMSSWHSHLPATLDPDAVVGLGMNAEELARNPVLTGRIVHDLNAESRLPFDDGSFEAVICTVSVEYLTDPFAVFRDLERILAPGGIAIVTFSNRWFPTKAIRIWEELHELERPGLVLEYFRACGGFRDLNTWSLRGLPRPADDKYAHRLTQSDPVHAVWARRAGEPRMRL
jgi:SAM-dependent methyltransferase/FKBP-type peptidyl-prolyl cis-trans isomerase 2